MPGFAGFISGSAPAAKQTCKFTSCFASQFSCKKPSLTVIYRGKLIVREMTDLLVLDLVEKRLVTDQMVLDIGYDMENLADPSVRKKYKGEVITDHFGRKVPKHAHGTVNLKRFTSSTQIILDAVLNLYDQIVNPCLSVRRITVTANRLTDETEIRTDVSCQQLDLFTDYAALEKEKQEEEARLAKERRLQEAVLTVKKKFGKNAILKGTNLQDGATTIERNRQIGGHKA